jgi:hypothetical protein
MQFRPNWKMRIMGKLLYPLRFLPGVGVCGAEPCCVYFLPNLCHPWRVHLRDQPCPNLIENTKTTTKPVQPGGIPLVLTEIDGRAGKLPSRFLRSNIEADH